MSDHLIPTTPEIAALLSEAGFSTPEHVIVHLAHVIGCPDWRIDAVYVPGATYTGPHFSEVMRIDGELCGRLTSLDLGVRFESLAGGSPERIAAVRGAVADLEAASAAAIALVAA